MKAWVPLQAVREKHERKVKLSCMKLYTPVVVSDMLMECIYDHWFVLQEWISQNNIILKAKPDIWNAMRSPLQVKHINDSMFIDDSSRQHVCIALVVDIIVRKAGVSVGFGRGGTSWNSGGISHLRRGVWGPLKVEAHGISVFRGLNFGIK